MTDVALLLAQAREQQARHRLSFDICRLCMTETWPCASRVFADAVIAHLEEPNAGAQQEAAAAKQDAPS